MRVALSARFRHFQAAFAILAAIGSATAATAADDPSAIARATTLERGDAVLGALPMSQPIHIEVALRMRNRDVLDAFIANAAKSRIGSVEHAMSQAQYLANHAPTQEQARKVADWLRQAGYTQVTIASNRLLVSADGTAATASRAFMTPFSQVRTHDGRIAWANTAAVRIPVALQDSILAVTGLQNVHVARPPLRPQSSQAAHSDAISFHNPLDFSSIYGGTGVKTAAGVTVGIITEGDMQPVLADLNAFTTSNGLAAVVTRVVNTNGVSSSEGGLPEWDLDSQQIVGMGGGQVGKIIFYANPDRSDADLTADYNTVVTQNIAKVINVSLGFCETDSQADGSAAAQDQIFALAAAQGQTFSVATGDDGADECGIGKPSASWPAASQYVVAVGGTLLDASKTTWHSEVVWNELASNVGATGGSPSEFEPKPYWQSTLVPGSTRGLPDVAFDADKKSSSLIIIQGALLPTGGTSQATPTFTGLWARVLATKGRDFGFAAPLLYQLPATDFHDITSGDNSGEKAGVGYDFASGRGSIILHDAIRHLGVPVGDPPVANFGYATSGLVADFTDQSTDSDGTITSHFWTFGDASRFSTLADPSHAFPGAGTYPVAETVADNDGNFSTKSASVTVVPPGGANQLIGNTGFEDFSASQATGRPWVLSSPAIILNHDRTPAEPSHGGQWDAWLDGYGQIHTDSVAQKILIPAGKTAATLHFFLHVDTHEVSPVQAYDVLRVRVFSTSGALLGTLASFSNLDAASGYKQHSCDMTRWIGQTVVLKFIGEEDPSLATSFVVDDVTVDVQ